jgi:hypothetical protein
MRLCTTRAGYALWSADILYQSVMVIPAYAGIQGASWIPAYAGMTFPLGIHYASRPIVERSA